jgi:hypothetical protein
VLATRGGFVSSPRAFSVFERALFVEAGIGAPHEGPAWTPVVVQQDARARPRSLALSDRETPQLVDVLGAVVGLSKGERGFRVRLSGGGETTVVQEPGGSWYTDEPIVGADARDRVAR